MSRPERGSSRSAVRTYKLVQEPRVRLAEGSRPYPIPTLTDDDLDDRPVRVIRAITSEDATTVSGEINGYQILENY